MMRSLVTAAIGGAGAIALAFLIVAVVSAVGGVPTLFDPERVVYGWEGAQYGMLLLAVIGAVKLWLFPAIFIVGAVVGVFVVRHRQRRAHRSQ